MTETTESTVTETAETAETAESTSACPHCGQATAAGDGQGDAAEVTAEQFAGMNLAQRAELYQANPPLYRKLAGR